MNKGNIQLASFSKRLFSVKEAGVYLGRSERAIRDMIYNGKLPEVRMDGRVFIDREDLDEVIERAKRRFEY